MTLKEEIRRRRQEGFYTALLERLERQGATPESPLHKAIRQKLRRLRRQKAATPKTNA